ncbi:condensation domain-containing protein, partial [Paramaledivibacter caminithermalis]
MGNTMRKYPPICNAEDKMYYPLSFQQDRLWYLSLLQPESTVWNLISCKRLKGRVNIEVLQQALEDIIDRHIVLRTRMKMINSSPVQYFHEMDDNTFQYINLSHMNEKQREIEAINILNKEGLTPMNVNGGQLFYATLIKLNNNDYIIILKLHHIISDAASFQIIWSELKQIYNGYLGVTSNSTLPLLEYDYKDYSVWQKENFIECKTREQEEYWLKEFKDEVSILELPTDYSSPANITFNGALEKEKLPADLVKKLRVLCLEKRVIMFSVLLSAYYVLLQKYSHQEDIVIGTVFSGRHYNQKIQKLVGFFVNTVAIRMNVDEKLTFENFLKQVHKKVEDAYYMQDYPFERLIQKLNPDRSNNNSRNPLFRVMFNMVTSYEENSKFDGVISEEWLEPEVNSTQVDILFDIHNSSDGIDIVVEYNTDIFRRKTILRIIKHYKELLHNIVSNPNGNIADIELITEQDKKQLLIEWNNTYVEYPKSKSINELFEEQVDKMPDKIAVVYEDEELTYKELNQRTNKLGRLLIDKGIEAEDIVGIMTDRSIDMVVGIIGILKAGGA